MSIHSFLTFWQVIDFMLSGFLELFKVLPKQLENYLQYCKLSSSIVDSCLDCKGKLSYIYPTTLLPLAVKYSGSNLNVLSNCDSARYLNFMIGTKDIDFEKHSTYMPPISLPQDKSSFNKVIEKLYNFHNNGYEYGGENTFKYMIGELSDNIYQHSNFSKAMIFAQKYPKKKFVEICIMDDGIGIPKSLDLAGLKFSDSDHEAIFYATQGLTSKVHENRGFGIGSCISAYCGKTDSSVLIVSKLGAFFIDKNLNPNLFKLPEQYKLEGTLVSFRVPYPCKEVDIYEGGILEKNIY